ncbi:uncharacterized protein AMSG_01156 [Thecamonas trahens ATCC 50062]|uniref:Uncharacterized protein n=1 Tax=Thecamonas trahens ATCC 50062 TaxID=461836 RepID=A0A0L0DIV6_THETB|nr:hypothetical protein AMSG_01156 [Thecamonas trahens ATCC 50062]KNC52324.1 hypothetical protein AMSG_01156 [Thecamonas trahens ATCC 50062]|eukprot:XP_013762320.1 hypothetical protein AMSG_01156 [Thecamonas trahens ATCC 50062]
MAVPSFEPLELDFDDSAVLGGDNAAALVTFGSDDDGDDDDDGQVKIELVPAPDVGSDDENGSDEDGGVSRKRKADDALEDERAAKKKKKEKKKKTKKGRKRHDDEDDLSLPISLLSGPTDGVDAMEVPVAQAKYLQRRLLSLLAPEMSSVELDAVAVPLEAMLPPAASEIQLGRFTRSLYGDKHMYDMLVAPRPQAEVVFGAPRILIVTAGGMRCADVVREVSAALKLPEKAARGRKVIRPAKLFAKHFKVAQQAKFLQTHEVNIGVGTPNRLIKLIEASDGLSLDRLEFVLLDIQRDAKERSLLDMHGVDVDAARLLAKHLLPLAAEGRLHIGLC